MTVVLREEKLKMNKPTKHGFRIIVAFLGIVALAGALFMQVNPAGASLAHLRVLNPLQRLWKELLQYLPAGTYYQELALKHQEEVQTLLEQHPEHIAKMWYTAELFAPGVEALLDGKGDPVITEKQIHALKSELEWLASVGSDSLRGDVETELQRSPLDQFVGLKMSFMFDSITENVPNAGTWVAPTPWPSATPILTPEGKPRTSLTIWCIVGTEPDCLTAPNLVPGSNGEWAYYVFDGIYFEYPSAWRIEKNSAEPQNIDLWPTSDSPESDGLDNMNLWVIYSAGCDIPYNPLAYPHYEWGYTEPIWDRLITLPDFEGSLFLDGDDAPPFVIYAIFCDPVTHMSIGMNIVLEEEMVNASLFDPYLALDPYPNYRHIMESLRILKP